ncbi:MAG: hypothetical protein QME42_05145 [bacterium]|nr:hypothetical protein [bacterium]
MKKLLVLLTALGVIGVLSVEAQSAEITITVQIQSIGVSVTPGAWAIGVVSAGSVQNSGTFTVTNTGNVAEDFQLNTGNSANWTNANATTQGHAAGLNQFALGGLFDTEGIHNFTTDDDITNSAMTASTTRFSDGDDSGVNVGVGASKLLWLRFGVPTAGSNTSAQAITTTITAIAH